MLYQLPFLVAECAGSFVRAGPSHQKDIPSCSSFTTIWKNRFLWKVCARGNIHYPCQIFIRKELHSRRRGTFWVSLYFFLLSVLIKTHNSLHCSYSTYNTTLNTYSTYNTIQYNAYTIYHAKLTLHGYAYALKQCNNLHYYQFLLIYIFVLLLLLINTALQICLSQ